jgi:hypothetical protein
MVVGQNAVFRRTRISAGGSHRPCVLIGTDWALRFGQENRGWLDFRVSLHGRWVFGAETRFFLPLRTPVAHVARWNMRSPQTKVSGSNKNGNADLGINISTHFRVRFFPFLWQESWETFEKRLGFLAKEATCLDNKGGEVPTLLEPQGISFSSPFCVGLQPFQGL